MNDLIFLTIEPMEGGHALPWTRVKSLLEGLEDALSRLSAKIALPDLEIEGASLIVVGSPVVGSQRWQFKLEIKAEIVSPKKPAPRRPQKDEPTKSLIREIGVNALGGVIAAAIMLKFAGPSEEPTYGPEAKLAEICADELKRAGHSALSEMRFLAEQAQCRSLRMQYQSYPPLELAGKVDPLVIGDELETPPPERLEIFLKSRDAVVIYLDGVKRTGYFVTRLDNNTEAIAIFRDPIPSQHLNDRIMTEAKLVSAERRSRMFISPLSLGGPNSAGIEARLKLARAILEIKANYGVMRNAASH